MYLVRPDLPFPLDHMVRLTDCFEIIQHVAHALPEYGSGYATDDNARALALSGRDAEEVGRVTASRPAAVPGVGRR